MNEYTIEFLDGTQQKIRADYIEPKDGLLYFYSKLTTLPYSNARILLVINHVVIKLVSVVEYPELLKAMDEQARKAEYENMINSFRMGDLS